MENNQQEQNVLKEPVNTENSSKNNDAKKLQTPSCEQSDSDSQQELLLGKFKSAEDLSKAYQELERYQGRCADELGSLRKQLASVNSVQQDFEKLQNFQMALSTCIERDKEKYNTPEYLQNPAFKDIYSEALTILGDNLDTDRLVNLLENYVNARIFANDKKKAGQEETQKVLDSLTYDKNPKENFTAPKKRFDEMTDKEINDLLDRLI